MRVKVNRKVVGVVELNTLNIRDTFRREVALDGDHDFILLGNNSRLTVMHSTGQLKDVGERLLVLNINTGTIGSMQSSDNIVRTDSELIING